MKILAIDSTAVAASAAVLEDDRLLGEFFIHTSLTHSQTLMPMVQQVLECVGVSVEDIDLFAAAAGPGSFTGVRIGVASIKEWRWPGESRASAFPLWRRWPIILPCRGPRSAR